MAKIISNAFSFNMVDWEGQAGLPVTVNAREMDLKEFKEELEKGGWESSVGHADIARVLSEMTGVEIPVNRRNDTLKDGDFVFVAQYTGPRLPEGATSLPEGAKIRFIRVYFEA